jgi:hypothetical protein
MRHRKRERAARRDSGRKKLDISGVWCVVTLMTARYLSSQERHESMSKSLTVVRAPITLSGSAAMSVISTTRDAALPFADWDGVG